MLLISEKEGDYEQAVTMNGIEVCDLPTLPLDYNSPAFLHPLSGWNLNIVERYKISELFYDNAVKFTVAKDSLLNFVLIVPADIEVAAELTKAKTQLKIKSTSSKLNEFNENFLKEKKLLHMNVVVLRELISPGTYIIRIGTHDEAQQGNGVPLEAFPYCESIQMQLAVNPLEPQQLDDEEGCGHVSELDTKMAFDSLRKGTLYFDTQEVFMDTTFANFEERGEGPFFFFFQIDYDMRQEGAISLVLSRYSDDKTNFIEKKVFSLQEGQSQIFDTIDEGVYVLSVQTIMNKAGKFGSRAMKLRGGDPAMYLPACVQINYSYFITSVHNGDAPQFNNPFEMFMHIMGMGPQVNVGNENSTTFQDRQQLHSEFRDKGVLSCEYQDIPKVLSNFLEFDQSWAFKMSENNFDVTDVIAEEHSIIRVFSQTRSSKNNLNVFLYDGSRYKNVLGYSEGSRQQKSFVSALPGQRNAYRLKLLYDSLDEADTCPLFDMRVAVKESANIVSENMVC